jgi:hypothetical protein
VEQIASVAGVALVFALIFSLGEWIFRRSAATLDARLQTGWRWLTLPATAILSIAAFLALRPFIVDQPRTPLWFIGAVIAVALLVTAGTAAGWAIVALGRAVLAGLRR